MIKSQRTTNTFSKGVDRDTAMEKLSKDVYFDAVNLRIISNESSSSGALSSVSGNELKLVFPYGDVILGFCKIRSNVDTSKDAIVFFNYNAIYEVQHSRIYLFDGDPFLVGTEVIMTGDLAPHTTSTDYDYECGLIYADNGLNFNPLYPIKAEGRYESAEIRKVYWVDGLNNIRYMILDKVTKGDAVTIFDINPEAILSEPVTTIISGGSYAAGAVQYAYQLYIKNGAVTTYSPLSPLLLLTANDGGIDSRTFTGSLLGKNTGKAVQLTISNLDPNYNRIRIVAIYYTESLVNPTINIVGELGYTGTTLTFIDNGFTVYRTVPIEEFRIFGQTNYIANSLASEYNYLFFADITEDKWNPDWLNPTNGTFWDSRAVRFSTGGTAVVWDGVTSLAINSGLTNWNSYIVTHDGINKYNDIINDDDPSYEYKYNIGGDLGAEGPNVLVEFETEDLQIDSSATGEYASIQYPYTNSTATSQRRESQRTEVYRTYIVFLNTKMQYSNPQWICDLRMPGNNDNGFQTIVIDGVTGYRKARYVYPKVTISNLPVDTNLYGWQIFRCERGSNDRSIMASGVISTCIKETSGTFTDLVRPHSSNIAPYCFIRAEDGVLSSQDEIIEIVSPEILFNKNLYYTSGDKLRVDGRYLPFEALTSHPTTNYLITLSLGATVNRDAGDTILYDVTEGSLQSLGIINPGPTLPPSQSMAGEVYKHTLVYPDIGLGGTYYGNRGSSFIAVISTNLTVIGTTPGYIYGSYLRNVFGTQYGGNTFEARSYNSVIPYSTVIPKDPSPKSVVCYNGDTFISMFAYLRSGLPNAPISGTQEMVYIPCESSINCFYRLDPIQKYYSSTLETYKLQETVEQGLQLQPNDYPLELGDLYRYNSIYSKSGDARLIQNIIFDSNTIEHSDVKVIASGKKINNEYSDSWTNLYTNNYIELDPKHGPINNIFSLNNKLFVGQNKAIAVLAVNDRSVIQDNNKIQLTLGTGGVLERYDYLTTSSGFQNYFDMSISDKSFYYFDRRNKIIYTLTQKGDVPISEINGYRSFLKAYGSISTVRVAYDPIYKEVLFYIADAINPALSSTSVFNEYTNSFNGKHSFLPDLMFNLNDQYYSVKNNTVYLHNYGYYGKFYGITYDSSLTVIINPNGNTINKFDVLELRVDVVEDGLYREKEQFTSIEMSNNYQGILTKHIAFSGNDSSEDTSKSLIRKWRTLLLPDNMTNEFYRMTDSYIKLKLIRINDGNKKLTCHDLTTSYRPVRN